MTAPVPPELEYAQPPRGVQTRLVYKSLGLFLFAVATFLVLTSPSSKPASADLRRVHVAPLVGAGEVGAFVSGGW